MLIAEIGLNHQGDLKKAKLMIEKAKEAGADIAKFQFYRPEEILGQDSPHLAEAKSCQFTWDQHLELRKHCWNMGIEWLLSIFHPEHVEWAVDAGMKRFKIASRAALNDNLLQYIAKTKLPVILSNGLCNASRLETIKSLLPNPKTYLYCVCKYPAAASDFDFDKMLALRKYAPSIGFSSHCPSILPATEAIRLGADVIEQHIVLDQGQTGCDVSSSITFVQLAQLVRWSKNTLRFVEILTDEQVEWIRQQRNRPEQYKYFRQDVPLSPEQQKKWWRTLDKSRVKLFIIHKPDGERIGYIGFNPLNRGSKTAEFGIFILAEHQGKGYGNKAMRQLLKYGFEDLDLSNIYSDVIDYPGENRFSFYKNLGFEAFAHQTIHYKKQGKTITSIKFFMTREMWNGQNRNGGVEPVRPQTVVQIR